MATLNSIVEERLRRALAVLSKHAQIRAAYIFGSQVEGTADADSDIDLALVVPEETDARVALRAAIRATMHRQMPLDLVVLHWRTAAESRTMLAREVRRDGILVYGKPL